MPTETQVKNRTTGAVIDHLEGVDGQKFNRAKNFYSAQKVAGKVLRPEWYNVGEVFRDAKIAFDGNTKKFGAWREKHFPGMQAPFASCAQTVALHKLVIEAWAEKALDELFTAEEMEALKTYLLRVYGIGGLSIKSVRVAS